MKRVIAVLLMLSSMSCGKLEESVIDLNSKAPGAKAKGPTGFRVTPGSSVEARGETVVLKARVSFTSRAD